MRDMSLMLAIWAGVLFAGAVIVAVVETIAEKLARRRKVRP